MEEIRFSGQLDCKVDNIGYICVERKAGFSFEFKSGKGKYTFLLVKSGEMEYTFAGGEKILKILPGQFLFIPKNLPYKAAYIKDNTTIKTINFDITGDDYAPYLTEPLHSSSRDYSSVFESITSANMRNTLFLSAKTYELMYLMQSDNPYVPKRYKKIIPAINEINSKYFENQKLSYYSDMCNMSEPNFRKLFKEYTGKTPVEYRNLIRITEAKKMIESGEFTATEAAYLAGFNNMSFFYVTYNKHRRR